MSIKIKIDDTWHIEDDGTQYALFEDTGVDKKGETIRKAHGYYGSLSGAVLKYCRLNVSDRDHDLKSYITEFNGLVEEIKERLT